MAPPSISSQLNEATAPPVTILRPLKGIDSNLRENLRSSFLQVYPNFELILSVADESDLAVGVVRELMSEFPKVDAKLLIGERIVGVNPKVNNLVRGYEKAKHDIIWILDSNIKVTNECLGLAVDILCGDSANGLVHHLPSVTHEQNSTPSLGSRVEWCVINTSHAKMYTAINSTSFGLASCVVGKSNLFRRSDLCGVGASADQISKGLEKFGKYMSEDNCIAQTILRHGKKHVLAPYGLAVQTHSSSSAMTLRDCVERHTRWKRTRKFSVPLATLVEPLTELVVNGVMGALGWKWLVGVNPYLFFFAHFIVWLGCDILIAGSLDPESRFPVGPWFLKELFALPHYLFAVSGSTVNWRGKLLKLRWDKTIVAVENKTRIFDDSHIIEETIKIDSQAITQPSEKIFTQGISPKISISHSQNCTKTLIIAKETLEEALTSSKKKKDRKPVFESHLFLKKKHRYSVMLNNSANAKEDNFNQKI
ncbi:hypothetical protein HK096_006892 [Nowakowskiella sp. JEL0078]|nr:hypothetical protein HK096_006892 [Nowakowskiella sp. JEL0078]